MSFAYFSIKDFHDAFTSGQSSAVEIVTDVLADIHARDGAIGAFLETFDARALAQAQELDQARARKEELGPLAGVPVAIKDNMLYAKQRASGGSKILENYISAYSCTAVERVIEAGGIIVGRTNMDEFGMGSSTERSAFQITRNPWNVNKIPGGSSGGNAAALAAGMVPLALGSDTGGSIRQPSAMCGTVGFKPTYGRVSRYGLMPMASSLDQIGPMTRTVAEAALVTSIIEGVDVHDQTSVATAPLDIPLAPACAGMRVGVPKEYFEEGLDPKVRQYVLDAVAVLRDAGATIVDISLPLQKMVLPVYYIVQPAETSSNLGRYDGLRYGTRHEGSLEEAYRAARSEDFGEEVKRRILLGAFTLSAGYADAYYKKALAVRSAIRRDFLEAFKKVDVIIGPTSPFVAWNIGEKMSDPLAMYLADIFTVSINICGLPAISIPCGMADGLPVGLQLQGAPFADATVLSVAAAFESLTHWHTLRP